MKFLYLILGLLVCSVQAQAQIIYGANNYTQYHIGTLPIIISAPHGGQVSPSNIPDRTCNSPSYDLDGGTIALARQIDTALFNLTGCRAHIIICNLRRNKVDCNRNLADGACGNINAENAWNDFHNFIDTAQYIAQNRYGSKALYIDLHGHGKKPYRLELGYGLGGGAYDFNDSTLNTATYLAQSSIENLAKTNKSGSTHAQLLRGSFALGTLFAKAGFPAVPSQQSPNTSGFPYFRGGYNTFNYTCIADGSNFDGLQIECDSAVRQNYVNRKKFADSTAKILIQYLLIHRNLNLRNNCDLTISGTENKGINTNSLTIFPNPVKDFVKLATEKIKGNYEVIILNVLGKIVFKTKNQNELDVSYLPSGLYLVQITDERKFIYTQKMVKL